MRRACSTTGLSIIFPRDRRRGAAARRERFDHLARPVAFPGGRPERRVHRRDLRRVNAELAAKAERARVGGIGPQRLRVGEAGAHPVHRRQEPRMARLQHDLRAHGEQRAALVGNAGLGAEVHAAEGETRHARHRRERAQRQIAPHGLDERDDASSGQRVGGCA